MKKLRLFIVAVLAVLPMMAFAGKAKVLKIDFKNPIAERKSGGSSMDLMSIVNGTPGSVTLLSYISAIDAAAQDKNIGMIYMTPENVSCGTAQLEELRAALERFRKAGKPIVAYCENFSNGSYYLASVADKVILDPASESMITGVGTQMIFLKDVLDALGVDVQLIRHGKYKAAGEMYTRSEASPENRLQNEVLVGSIWKTISTQIAASRGCTPEQFNQWVENLDMIHAADYKAKGLVDETWYKDEVDKYLCEQNGVSKISEVSFVKINKYASKLKKGSRKNKIAVVYADGEIVNSGSDADIVGSKMANTLRKVREDKKVKAVVFRVNSPGGSAQAAEAIRHELQLLRAEKPVIVSFGDYAASGGYWISAESDYIFSDYNTLTGSIGVFGLIPSVGNAIQSLEQYLQSEGYTFSLPTDESSNAYYTMPTAQPKLLQMGCVASPRDAIAGASGTSAKNSNFVHFLFAMKYLDKAPFASATGYSFYAINNTSTKTASICRNNCRDKTSGDLADRSVIACMCQSSANLNKSTGCFYGAKMYRNGRIEKFTSGNSRAQDCKG